MKNVTVFFNNPQDFVRGTIAMFETDFEPGPDWILGNESQGLDIPSFFTKEGLSLNRFRGWFPRAYIPDSKVSNPTWHTPCTKCGWSYHLSEEFEKLASVLRARVLVYAYFPDEKENRMRLMWRFPPD